MNINELKQKLAQKQETILKASKEADELEKQIAEGEERLGIRSLMFVPDKGETYFPCYIDYLDEFPRFVYEERIADNDKSNVGFYVFRTRAQAHIFCDYVNKFIIAMLYANKAEEYNMTYLPYEYDFSPYLVAIGFKTKEQYRKAAEIIEYIQGGEKQD